MKLSDLLGAEIIDDAGANLGKVHDVRVVQDGPVLSPFGASLRIEGLVVGRGSLGERLGLHRSRVKGPWILKRFFDWRFHAPRFVPWEAVNAITPRRIYIDRRASALKPVETL